MKKQTIMLRGEAFIFTEAAEYELRRYLKELGRATVVQKTAYLECTEALREVLHDKLGTGKTVTEKMVVQAIAIVGVPPVTPENIFASVKLGFHDVHARLLNFEGGWRDMRRLTSALLASVALFAGIFIGAASVMVLLLDQAARKGTYQEFSYGVVRMTLVPPPFSFMTTGIVAGMLFISGVCLVLCGYWLLREKHGFRPWIGVFIGTIIFGGAFLRLASSNDTISYLQTNRVYLMACSREIPLYLPDSAPYTVFSQLRKEGYQLVAKIPTNRDTMLMDPTVLCKSYDKLAQQPDRDAVLQLYKESDDGTSLPFDQYNDVGGNWSFGLFAKP